MALDFGFLEPWKDTEDPTIVPLDGQTQGLLNQSALRTQEPLDAYKQKQNQGIIQAQAALGGVPSANDSAKSGLTDAMKGGIRNLYQQKAGPQIAMLAAQNNIQGQMAKANAANKYMQQAFQLQKNVTDNYNMLTNAYNQQEAARAGMVAALTGLGGTALGQQKADNRAAQGQFPAAQTNPSMNQDYASAFGNINAAQQGFAPPQRDTRYLT